jgi:hypothetical protein
VCVSLRVGGAVNYVAVAGVLDISPNLVGSDGTLHHLIVQSKHQF